jgi:hypothetical protein
MYKYIIAFWIFVSLSGCGEGIVSIDNKLYEPKIVIYGFLQPRKNITNISISRNYPLNHKIDQELLYLKSAVVIVTDLELNKNYQLFFNDQDKCFERPDVVVRKGVSYKLSVSAIIDGNKIEASAVTDVPKDIPLIDTTRSKLAPFRVYDKDSSGEYKYFEVCWKFSPVIDYYLFRREVVNIVDSNMISFTPFDYWEKYSDLRRIRSFDHTIELWNNDHSDNYYNKKIEVIEFACAGKQRFILTSGDINFRDYVTQPKEVTDVDGNLYEPKYHINGMGIGVFGSMVSDTVEVMLYNYNSNAGTVIVTP